MAVEGEHCANAILGVNLDIPETGVSLAAVVSYSMKICFYCTLLHDSMVLYDYSMTRHLGIPLVASSYLGSGRVRFSIFLYQLRPFSIYMNPNIRVLFLGCSVISWFKLSLLFETFREKYKTIS